MSFFLIVVPYAAVAAFLIGIILRVTRWARSSVPFRITGVCGQQKSLAWIPHDKLDSPASSSGVLGRMALEILLFRSLFRNNKARLDGNQNLTFTETKLLWLTSLLFHYALLVIALRHLRFVLVPVPQLASALQRMDAFFQIGLPARYVTDVLVVAALTYLMGRRIWDIRVRYFSLLDDYLSPVLLLGLILSGIGMRYFSRTDLTAVKDYAVGMVSLHPHIPAVGGALFYAHMLFFSALLAYFPFSKLVHMGGAFLSPTRNLANNNRRTRHINPWHYPVKVHRYAEWEEEFRSKIKAAGLPMERE